MSVLASNLPAGGGSSGSKDMSSAATGQNNDPKAAELVKLLEEVNDRLKRAESERELLWRELDEYRKILNEMEDKTHASEKAYLSLEHKLTHRDKMTEEMIDRQEKLETTQTSSARELEDIRTLKSTLEKRLMDQQGASDTVLKRTEEALAAVAKIDRRFERFNQDKGRLLRKIERMESIIEETQDALRAKALVLLTDHTVNRALHAPQVGAWDEKYGFSPPPLGPEPAAPAVISTNGAAAPARNHRAWWPGALRTAASLLVLAGVGLGVGYGLAYFLKSTPQAQPSVEVATRALAPQVKSAASSTANTAPPAEPEVKITLQDQINAQKRAAGTDETTAEQEIVALKDKTSLRNRIKADAALPGAIKGLERSALSGKADAQNDLASLYAVGQRGVVVNPERAAFWFKEAALNGVAAARYNLGVMHHQGLGMDKNMDQAMVWYQAAAAKGHPEALYNLGIAYLEGTGQTYNPVRAASYFERAAVAGVPDAAYNLGLIHENGVMGQKSAAQALFWFKLATDRGSPQGKEALARLRVSEGLSESDVEKVFSGIREQRSDLALPVATSTANVSSAAASDEAPTDDPKLITQIQTALTSVGLYEGSADGRMTDELAASIRAFQEKIGETPDGVATREVLEALKAGQIDNVVPAAGE